MAVDDSFTKALLHMDGADASTTFTDESGKTWVAYNHSQLDTAQYKFSPSSGLFDGTDDYCLTGNNEDFDFGTGNFTIDTWARPASTDGYRTIVAATKFGGGDPGWGVGFNNSGKIRFVYSGTNKIVSTTTPSTSSFNHIAVVRNGNNLNLYYNGTAEGGTVDVTGQTFNSGAVGATIGRLFADASSDYYNGWVDELRISKGIARWTGNFTPPTDPYASSFVPVSLPPMWFA